MARGIEAQRRISKAFETDKSTSDTWRLWLASLKPIKM
jgi:hypothetical protein